MKPPTKPTARGGQLQVFKAEFFKALAHPIRIHILEILVRGERSVHELQEALGVDQPTVSQQLAMLRAKNIVEARKVAPPCGMPSVTPPSGSCSRSPGGSSTST